MGDEKRQFSCQETKDSVRQFLDDLLSDEDYGLFCRHLEECVSCREYVASIGSLSNQVYELGSAVTAPPDLVSTVLFRLKSASSPRPVSRTIAVLVIAVAVAFAVIVLAVSSGIMGKKPGKRGESDKRARTDMLGAAPEAVSEIPGASQTAEPPAAVAAAKTEEPQPLKPFHWHVTVREKGEEEKLVKTIEGLGAQTEYRKGGLLVLMIPAAGVRTIRAALAFGSSLRDFTAGSSSGAPAEEKGNQEISIFFDRQFPAVPPAKDNLISRERDPDGQALHWHILLVMPKKDEVMELLRLAGGIREFETRDTCVFTVFAPEVEPLAAKLRAREGVFAEIDEQAMKRIDPGEKVRLSLYFMEK